MDRYTEDENAKNEFFHNEMMNTKRNALLKIKYMTKDEKFLEMIADLIVFGYGEGLKEAVKLKDELEFDDLDHLAIIEDQKCFEIEYNELKEMERDYE